MTTPSKDRSGHSGSWEITQQTRLQAVELVLQHTLSAQFLENFEEHVVVEKADVIARYLANGHHNGVPEGDNPSDNE